MAININLTTKLAQQLKITPQLQQAIKLLQLSRSELEATIRKELNENPVLEEIQDIAEDDPARKNKEIQKELNIRKGDLESSHLSSHQDSSQSEETDLRNDSDLIYNKLAGVNMQESGNVEQNYENIVSVPKNLKNHLIWQVSLYGFNENEEKLLSILISAVGEDGYIRIDLGELAQDESVDVKLLEEMLPFLHELDPPGVGARDLKECLLIQAKHMEEDTHDLTLLIKNHLKTLEKRNFLDISKTTGWTTSYIESLHKIILEMNPKPGFSYSSNYDTHYITPDVYVYKNADDYLISLNEEGLPRIQISEAYKNFIGKKGINKESQKKTKEFIQEKFRAATWLIKSIQQRQKTIYKVSESILKHQRDFFDHGPSYIKPMILRDIANDIGMHESTVSRATSSKYIHTPQGIFELKYFFNPGVRGSKGNAVASESIKLKIKKIVERENIKSPYSDQKLVEILESEGIKIARRTVAKYREMLKILPSSKRKKFF